MRRTPQHKPKQHIETIVTYEPNREIQWYVRGTELNDDHISSSGQQASVTAAPPPPAENSFSLLYVLVAAEGKLLNSRDLGGVEADVAPIGESRGNTPRAHERTNYNQIPKTGKLTRYGSSGP